MSDAPGTIPTGSKATKGTGQGERGGYRGKRFDPNYRNRQHHQGATEPRNHQAHTTAPKEIAFKGRCDELDGFTYTVTTSTGGLDFSKTQKRSHDTQEKNTPPLACMLKTES